MGIYCWVFLFAVSLLNFTNFHPPDVSRIKHFDDSISTACIILSCMSFQTYQVAPLFQFRNFHNLFLRAKNWIPFGFRQSPFFLLSLYLFQKLPQFLISLKPPSPLPCLTMLWKCFSAWSTYGTGSISKKILHKDQLYLFWQAGHYAVLVAIKDSLICL